MFTLRIHAGWGKFYSSLIFILTTILLSLNPSAQAEPHHEESTVGLSAFPIFASNSPVTNSAPAMTQPTLYIDPLDSPYPVPWNWVMANYNEFLETQYPDTRYYRSPSLISPDGQYAVYSRIKMQMEPELFRSRVSSVMFLENLETGHLQTVTASSPLSDNPFEKNEEAQLPGVIAILIPVSWSQSGDRILARQFEGLFSTSNASDYAVIWDRNNQDTVTLSPQKVQYTNAVLLGWSHNDPNKVLFRAGLLGEEQWPIWGVNLEGQTLLAGQEKPIVYGQMINYAWTGPQARW